MAPIIQIVGYKNSGKTTLIARLVAMLHTLNLRVAVIKHDVHGFEVDREGTDTYRHRQAGASAAAIVSPWRTAIVEERETPLADLIGHFQAYDLIIVEGFKREPYPKIVLIRSAEDEHLLTELGGVCAAVYREEALPDPDKPQRPGLHCFERNDVDGILSFLKQNVLV
ncbi:molybdopterin-guanine dinucleotide biosynthesis protein B [Paenibacillus macerans]|uniref:Molybdopterin-guanine dinucleotide biosynthesis protein B n=1 Tax=Paenibacillus macerans TaxID=44252 RepID=A0A6N8ESY6_PAEMA|nr:molybdopterin-guanine dinucleotide biosynthesis protein B [Paenibacillus macerans]MUG23386.1 molybdopterin-guanine dinucleotide biosynthesis protein B [Paenibacillus macerans]UMV45887.1 molybdopterin-guanine dinucleotide biosynthesis protein B [Paenibacillus macerans]